MNRPPRRQGFFGNMYKNPDLALYSVFLGTDKEMFIHFRHDSDGYEEWRSFYVRSIERKEYPNPHIVRGVLETDLNRPGEDAGDNPIKEEVVVEVWQWFPETLVYHADRYQPIVVSEIESRTGKIIFSDLSASRS